MSTKIPRSIDVILFLTWMLIRLVPDAHFLLLFVFPVIMVVAAGEYVVW